MRVTVDYELCEGNALCTRLVPEVFEVLGDGDLHLLDEDPPEELRPRLVTAVRSCPRGALSLDVQASR